MFYDPDEIRIPRVGPYAQVQDTPPGMVKVLSKLLRKLGFRVNGDQEYTLVPTGILPELERRLAVQNG